MRQECIGEVQTAIGRNLTKAEITAIEDKISYQLHAMARNDPTAFRSMSESQRYVEAAKLSLEDHVYESQKKAQRKASNVLAQARETTNIAERAKELGGKTPYHKALFERLRQVDLVIKGERARAFSQIMDAINAAEPKFFGLLDDANAIRDFVYEVHGNKTGNDVAGRGAKAWAQQIENLRQRANAAGADIGQLDYGYLPQPHNAARIVKAGADKWIDNILPKLDRTRYLNDDGSVMTDAQMRPMLERSYETITTDGLNKLEPGQRGQSGGRAGKFDNAHREIHFKDADSYLDYMNEFGQGTVFEGMQNHVFGMTKDIAMMEQLGANPSQTFNLLHETARSQDRQALQSSMGAGREFGATPEMVWNALNGTTNSPANVRFAEFNQGIRNFLTATKLQSAMLSSVTDLPTLLLTAKYHNLPLGKTLVNTLKSFGGDYRAEAAKLGLATDSIISDMSRWHGENLAQGWSSKLASTTMKLSLLEGWTNALRRGFSVTMMERMGAMTRGDWSTLGAADKKLMQSRGITEADWRVWQQAMPEDWNGQKMLTADAISAVNVDASTKNGAIAKLLGFIADESEYASLGPGLMTRAAMTQGLRRGTLGGELIRHGMLFKSFPLGIVERHLRRINEIDGAGGKLAYSAALMTSLTLFGAMALQLKDIANGKDPRDMTGDHAAKFWAAAWLQGGGMGIYGDILYTGMGGDSRGGQANWMGMLGPVAGTAFDLTKLTLGNLGKAAEGKDTKFGAEAVRLAKQNTPFVNLWYAKAAIDHAITHEVQETLSPGYLSRMRRTTRKEWDQGYWWEPGEVSPDHLPDIAGAFGG